MAMTYMGDLLHTEHCCLFHGCRYGEAECPVMTKKKPQSFPCMDCEVGAGGDVMSVAIREGAEELARLKEEASFIGEAMRVAFDDDQHEVVSAATVRMGLINDAQERLIKQFIKDWLTSSSETPAS